MLDRTEPLPVSPDAPPQAFRRRMVVVGLLGGILLAAIVGAFLAQKPAKEDQWHTWVVKRAKENQRHTSSVRSGAFSANGKRVVLGSLASGQKTRDSWGEVKVWDAHMG
jgi:hypothetical protein